MCYCGVVCLCVVILIYWWLVFWFGEIVCDWLCLFFFVLFVVILLYCVVGVFYVMVWLCCVLCYIVVLSMFSLLWFICYIGICVSILFIIFFDRKCVWKLLVCRKVVMWVGMLLVRYIECVLKVIVRLLVRLFSYVLNICSVFIVSVLLLVCVVVIRFLVVC